MDQYLIYFLMVGLITTLSPSINVEEEPAPPIEQQTSMETLDVTDIEKEIKLNFNSFISGESSLEASNVFSDSIIPTCDGSSPFNSRAYETWHTGDGSGLSFGNPLTNDLPTTFLEEGLTSELPQGEGGATFCDPVSGEVLIYSNGQNIWSASGTLFTGPDGISLTNNLTNAISASGSPMIVTPPGQCGDIEELYVFFTDGNSNLADRRPLYYISVDLNAQTFSAVDSLTNYPVSEQINAVQTSCDSIWIVYRAPSLDDPLGPAFDLHAVLWTMDGFAPPVITPEFHLTGNWGYTSTFSLDGSKFASTYYVVYNGHTGMERVLVCDFNQNTGAFCNPIYLNPRVAYEGPQGPQSLNYGVAFSPDNTKLFTNVEGDIINDPQWEHVLVQFDLTLGNVGAIEADFVKLETNVGYLIQGALRNAPDGRIYCSPRAGNNSSNATLTEIRYIENPNSTSFSLGALTVLDLANSVKPTSNLNNFVYGKGPAACLPLIDTIAIVDDCSNEILLSINSCYLGAGGPYTLHYESAGGSISENINNLTPDDNFQVLISGVFEGTYNFQLIDANGCGGVIVDDLDITYPTPGEITITSDMICAGDSSLFGSTYYFNTGTYFDTIVLINGCDSIVQLDLTVLDNSYTFISELSCNSSDTGLVETILQNQQLCDSIVQVYTSLPYYAHLRNSSISTFRTNTDGTIEDLILPGNERFNIDYFPNGDSIFLSGNRANNYIGGPANDYSDSFLDLIDNNLSDIPALLLRNKSGNTSKLSFDLSVDNPDYFDFIIWDIDERDVCSIEVYDINENLLSVGSFSVFQGGLFDHPNPPDNDIIEYVNDTIIVSAPLNDMVGHRSYFILRFENTAISKIDVNFYGEDESCQLSETNARFCPNVLFSLYIPELIGPIADAGPSSIVACEGETIVLDGSGSDAGGNITYLWTLPDNSTSNELNPEVNESGQYLLTVTLNDGICEYTAMDSVDVVFLSPPLITIVNDTICAGDSSILSNIYYFDTGIYSDTILLTNGCDSIIQLDLIVYDTFYILRDTMFCEGDCINIASTDYCETTTVLDTMQSQSGCDSIIEWNINMLPISSSTLDVTLCTGESIMICGNTFDATGIYEVVCEGMASNGCDSIVQLDLELQDALYTIRDTTFCEGDCISIAGADYCESIIVLDSLESQSGCDSIVEWNLVIRESPNAIENAVLCFGDSIERCGIVYNTPGNYEIICEGMAANGCDSLLSLNVDILPLDTTTVYMDFCVPEDTLVSLEMLTNQFGCDSIVTFVFQENEPQLIEDTILICDPEEVGEETQVILNVLDCDSLIIATTYILAPIPVLADDNFIIDLKELPFNGDVTLNDIFLPFGASVRIISQSTNGDLVDNGGGTFTFSGSNEVIGLNMFNYEICDTICPNLCDTATVVIEVESDIQDVLTPNGDGFNDEFDLTNLSGDPEKELTIFNRWGDIIYKRKPYSNEWYGQNERGEELPAATYFYLLKYKEGENIIQIKGHITILR